LARTKERARFQEIVKCLCSPACTYYLEVEALENGQFLRVKVWVPGGPYTLWFAEGSLRRLVKMIEKGVSYLDPNIQQMLRET